MKKAIFLLLWLGLQANLCLIAVEVLIDGFTAPKIGLHLTCAISLAVTLWLLYRSIRAK